MLDGMTGQQMTEVLAFAENEPLHERRADVRTALQTFQLAKVHGSKATSIDTFLMDLDRADRLQEQTPNQMDAAFTKLNRQRREVA